MCFYFIYKKHKSFFILLKNWFALIVVCFYTKSIKINEEVVYLEIIYGLNFNFKI